MAKKQESAGRTAERSSGIRASHASRVAPERDQETTTSELLERGKEKLGEFRDTAVDTASEWASDARDAVSTAARRTQETISPVTESVRQNPWPAVLIGAGLTWLIVDGMRSQGRPSRSSASTGGEAERAGQSSAAASGGATRSVQDNVWRFVRRNPLLAGATAVGLGAAFSMTLPETEQENELLGETRDAVVDRAKDMARGTMEAAQSVAETVQQLAGRS